MWKSLPLQDFPPETVFYWYRSGLLLIPNWPGRNSMLTPSSESPHAFKPVKPPVGSPARTLVSHPVPLHQPLMNQHRLFYGESTSQSHIPKHLSWSGPSQRYDPETPIPNVFPSQNPWMDTDGPNTPFAYQPAPSYSFQDQIAADPFRNEKQNQHAYVTKEPRSCFTKEQQMEIDRQIASRLQEMGLARANTRDDQHQQQEWQREPAPVGSYSHPQHKQHKRHCQQNINLPQERWYREPAPVGSFNYQRPNGLTRPFEHWPGESTNVEFPNRHQGAVHEMQQHPTTPLSRKPKRNHQNQRQTHRQTQQHWEPQVPSYNQQANYTGQPRTFEPHHQSQQNYHRQYNSKNFDHPKQRQFNQPWTSTPRDRNSRYNSPKSQTWFGDNSTNNTLVNLLDTQCKV